MKIASLCTTDPPFRKCNIGDAIQTLAVEQHLPRVDLRLDRDSLDTYEGDECTLVMNGWFSHKPENWPPSPRIYPIFHGFHVSKTAGEYYEKYIEYFRKHQPIGCRDKGTRELLKKWGLETYLSHCLTLTFSKRTEPPEQDLLVAVDVGPPLPRAMAGKSIRVHHNIAPVGQDVQFAYARGLLSFYRDHASHLITSRIHAAMPAIAIGIPTLYVGKQEYRTNILREIGIPQAYIWNSKNPLNQINKYFLDLGGFYQPDLEPLKERLIRTFEKRLLQYGIKRREQ